MNITYREFIFLTHGNAVLVAYRKIIRAIDAELFV